MTDDNEKKPPTRRQTARAQALEKAKQLHEDWSEDYGSDGDSVSDLAYRSHLMELCRITGQDENMVIEGGQLRQQAGLEPLDMPKLILSLRLQPRIVQSREEILDATIENEEQAAKAALRKKQRAR